MENKIRESSQCLSLDDAAALPLDGCLCHQYADRNTAKANDGTCRCIPSDFRTACCQGICSPRAACTHPDTTHAALHSYTLIMESKQSNFTNDARYYVKRSNLQV